MTTSENVKKKGLACEANPNKPLDTNNTSINNQHKIIYSALVIKPQSTIDLRHGYGIMQPAPRIKELRDIKYIIKILKISSLIMAVLYIFVYFLINLHLL